MKTFKDKNGNEWNLELNGLAVRDIDSTDYSALVEGDYRIARQVEGGKFWETGVYDRALILAMAWVAIRGQNKAIIEEARKAIDELRGREEGEATTAEEAFVSLLDGPSIRFAYDAFMEELADFFPQRRTVLTKLIRLSGEVEKKASQRIVERLDKLAPRVDELIDRELDKAELAAFGQ